MENAKILIVDDDTDFAKGIQAMFEAERYDVILASDRDEGMHKTKTERPDLVILDVMMATWEDGFEMARELKKDPDSQQMPILMLTGVKQKTGINFKSTAGDSDWCPVDAFLDKPAEPDILLSKVKELLKK